MERTGAYGAALSRSLCSEGVRIVEMAPPDRKTRQTSGKFNAIDAYAAVLAALSGRPADAPKNHDGRIKAIQALRVTDRSAVRSAPRQSSNCVPCCSVAPPGSANSCVSWPQNVHHNLRRARSYC